MIQRLWGTLKYTSSVFITVLLVTANFIPVESNAQDKLPQKKVIQEHIDKGIQLGNVGEFQKAISEFNKVLQLDPKNIHAYNNLGVVYFSLGNVDGVISSCTKAINLGIADANMYFFRGLMYGKYKYKDVKAIEDYSKAIELNPNFTRAYLNRAFAYSFLNMQDKAIADYNKVVELSPSDLGIILESRAQVYYKKGNYKMAWDDFEKAKELGVTFDKKFLEKLEKASPQKR